MAMIADVLECEVSAVTVETFARFAEAALEIRIFQNGPRRDLARACLRARSGHLRFSN